MLRKEVLELLGGEKVLVTKKPRGSAARATKKGKTQSSQHATGNRANLYPPPDKPISYAAAEKRAAYGDSPAARGFRVEDGFRALTMLPFKTAAVDNLATLLEVHPDDLMAVIGIFGRTAQRRWQQGELTPEESDRLYRATRIVHKAIDSLGSQKGANHWLKRPQPMFEDRPPIALLGSDAGAIEVENQLNRIAYGIFS